MGILLSDGAPLMAMTLGYDRLHNFRFTLCHELAHGALHFGEENSKSFFDDLDRGEIDAYEKDADEWATEGLNPRKIWLAEKTEGIPTTNKLKAFAAKLRISPAIPAGRIRKERRDYRLFSNLIGNRKVRELF